MYIKKKLKVGILTLHSGINHGTYLQCYALYKTLNNLGYDVEIINYKNFMNWIKEYKIFLLTKNIKNLVNNIKKIKKFKKNHKKLELGELLFTHKGVYKKYYNVIVVGSDEVWNFKNPLVGYDALYFGHNLNSDKIIAYSPSFGNLTIKDKFPPYVTKGLKRFHAISLRDKNSQIIIEKLLGYKPEITLDPTFLYNFFGEEIQPNYKNYILIYGSGFDDRHVREIKKFGKKHNKKIISIAYKNKWCDINVIALGSFEFLGYFKNSDYIITNTFHGTIFSIIYKKQFVSIPNRDKKNKIISFMKLLSLKNILINDDLTLILYKKIEYNTIIEKIEFLRKKSLRYLMENINK